MIDAFIALETADDLAIASFAKRWGLLGVQRFYEPSDGRKVWKLPWGGFDFESSRKHDGYWVAFGSEPLHVWRYWVRRFSAALRVASQLKLQQNPGLRDWEILILGQRINPDHLDWNYDMSQSSYKPPDVLDPSPLNPPQAHSKQRLTPGERQLIALWKKGDYKAADKIFQHLSGKITPGSPGDRLAHLWTTVRFFAPGLEKKCPDRFTTFLLEDVINHFAQIGRVDLRLNWDCSKVEITTESLFSCLCWQLMNTIAARKGYAVCDGCGETFETERQPSPNRRHFCSNCGITVQRKLATRRFRERERLKETQQDAETPRE